MKPSGDLDVSVEVMPMSLVNLCETNKAIFKSS